MDLVRKTNKSKKDKTKQFSHGKGVYDTMFDPKIMLQKAEYNGYNLSSSLHASLHNDFNFTKIPG